MIIVIEGMDASGKATHSRMLAERMSAKRFAFPNYESATGKAILSHLKKKWWCTQNEDYAGQDQMGWEELQRVDAMVFQCLQTVNRLEILPEIDEALQHGHVIFDRYWQSGYVYGALDGCDRSWLKRTQQDPMPPADVNILIDIPVEEGFKRRPERRDRYESDRPYLEKVRLEYQSLWGMHHRDPRWKIVNGMGTIEEVAARVDNAVVLAVGA